MQLIVKFDIGDDYTWSATATYPVEYESAEQLLVDFEVEVLRALDHRKKAQVLHNQALAAITVDWEKYRELRGQELLLDTNVNFLGEQFTLDTFYYFEGKEIKSINIFTVDEWFAQEGKVPFVKKDA